MSKISFFVFVWAIGVLGASVWLAPTYRPGTEECGVAWMSVSCGSVR